MWLGRRKSSCDDFLSTRSLSSQDIITAMIERLQSDRFLADRTIGRAFGTLCLSVVCCLWRFVLWRNGTSYLKLSEGVNRKPGSKSWFWGSPPWYFYFRFHFYGHRDGRFCLIFARTAQRQGHVRLKVSKTKIFKIYLLRHFSINQKIPTVFETDAVRFCGIVHVVFKLCIDYNVRVMSMNRAADIQWAYCQRFYVGARGHSPPILSRPPKFFQGNLGLTFPHVTRLR